MSLAGKRENKRTGARGNRSQAHAAGVERSCQRYAKQIKSTSNEVMMIKGNQNELQPNDLTRAKQSAVPRSRMRNERRTIRARICLRGMRSNHQRPVNSGSEGFSGARFGAPGGFADHGEIGRDAEVASAPVAQLGHHGDEFVASSAQAV